jgi:fatty-acyl-CoA synthase
MVNKQQLLLKSILTTALQRTSQHQIISEDGGSYSYCDLNDRIAKLGNVLTTLGIGEGSVVAVMDWDTHRYLECFFAVPMVGAVLHTINIRLAPAQIAYTIDHAEDDLILINSDFLSLIGEVLPLVKRKVRIVLIGDSHDEPLQDVGRVVEGYFEIMMNAAMHAFDFPDFDENLRATTFYTTGTTGEPKAVAYSHRQIVLHTMGIISTFGPMASSNRLHHNDVYMPITPMFHVHGWGFPYAATLLGLRQVYPGQYKVDKIVQLIHKHKVTFSHCVPTILQMILDCDETHDCSFENWKIVIGGSALSRGLAERALAKGINLFSAYGLSETCPLLTVAHLDPEDESDISARLKAGKPAAMVELRVVDEEMEDLPCDGVSVGEIVVRAPWLNAVYLKDDLATKELWRGGYLHTGDVGRLDFNGNLIITDRIKDVIKSGGEWISSIALESIASAVDGVAEVAAIGIPDSRWGERPMLLVVPSDETDGGPLHSRITAAFQKAIADGELSKWAIPERIDLVSSIAKTSVGKFDKKKLRSMLAESNAD